MGIERREGQRGHIESEKGDKEERRTRVDRVGGKKRKKREWYNEG